MNRLEAAEAEIVRLRSVILTGGAMYRAERASLGVPGGFEALRSFEVEQAARGLYAERTGVGELSDAAYKHWKALCLALCPR